MKMNILILSMKIRAIDIDLKDAEHFDSFSSIIFNCEIKYCCFNKNLDSTKAKNFSQVYMITL